MSDPDKNILPFSPVTAIAIIAVLLLIPLLVTGFFSR